MDLEKIKVVIRWRYLTVTQGVPWRYYTITHEVPWRYCTVTQKVLWRYHTVIQKSMPALAQNWLIDQMIILAKKAPGIHIHICIHMAV